MFSHRVTIVIFDIVIGRGYVRGDGFGKCRTLEHFIVLGARLLYDLNALVAASRNDTPKKRQSFITYYRTSSV
jgi:hypothetical protein